MNRHLLEENIKGRNNIMKLKYIDCEKDNLQEAL